MLRSPIQAKNNCDGDPIQALAQKTRKFETTIYHNAVILAKLLSYCFGWDFHPKCFSQIGFVNLQRIFGNANILYLGSNFSMGLHLTKFRLGQSIKEF